MASQVSYFFDCRHKKEFKKSLAFVFRHIPCIKSKLEQERVMNQSRREALTVELQRERAVAEVAHRLFFE